jgi:hypothetical protein
MFQKESKNGSIFTLIIPVASNPVKKARLLEDAYIEFHIALTQPDFGFWPQAGTLLVPYLDLK